MKPWGHCAAAEVVDWHCGHIVQIWLPTDVGALSFETCCTVAAREVYMLLRGSRVRRCILNHL